jgi:hypothetical protein
MKGINFVQLFQNVHARIGPVRHVLQTMLVASRGTFLSAFEVPKLGCCAPAKLSSVLHL